MKKLIFIILLIPSLVWGASFNGSANFATGVSSGACSTPLTGDEMNEGFLGVGYENVGEWAEVLNGGTIEEDFSLTNLPAPPGSCEEGLQTASPVGNVSYAEWDRGSAIADGTANVSYMEFQVTDKTADAFASFTIFYQGPNAGGSGYYTPLEGYNNNQQMQIRGKC